MTSDEIDIVERLRKRGTLREWTGDAPSDGYSGQGWIEKRDPLLDEAATLVSQLRGRVAEMEAALRPFVAMSDVLDCRDMNESSPTFVSVRAPFQEDCDYFILSGEVADDQLLISACASAKGTPAAYFAQLKMSDFRRAMISASPSPPSPDRGMK